MTTYQYQTVIDTDTVKEVADTNPTGVAYLTEATDPLGVATTPTKGDSKQDDKDNANVIELRQKEKYLQSAHFDIDEDLPKSCRYRLRERICREIPPINTSTNDLLFLQQYMDQYLCPIGDIVTTQYKMKQGLKRFCQSGVSAI